MRIAAAASVLAVLATIACARSPEPQSQAPVASRHVRNRFWVREDAAVTKVEPAPHDGGGDSTAYRYFDDVPDQRVIFRELFPIGVTILDLKDAAEGKGLSLSHLAARQEVHALVATIGTS